MIIYVDETNYYENRNHGREFVGIGVLLVEDDAISSEIISDALSALQNDPERSAPDTRKRDSRTLKRGYFHASEDSKNAHSWLCRKISAKLKGEYKYIYQPRTTAKASYDGVFDLVGIALTDTNAQVVLKIERRSDMSKIKANELVEHVFRGIEWGSYEWFMIPSYFRPFEVIICDKDEPGIQITDFLTWTVNRTRMDPPDKRWAGYIKKDAWSRAGAPGGTIDQGTMEFGRAARDPLISTYPCSTPSDFHGNDHLVELFCSMAEQVDRFLASTDVPPTVQHVHDFFQWLRRPFEDHLGAVRAISSCFLWIFDTMPIYSPSILADEKAFGRLLLMKRLAGLTLRSDIINGTRTATHLARVLQWLKERQAQVQ
jgi:hypothetical protein